MLGIMIAIIPFIIAIIAHVLSSAYAIRFATTLLMWISLVQSLNTITGYIGRIDFGHVMFFGIGAYTATLTFLYVNTPWYLSILLAPVTSVLLALIIGYPTLRLHGAYFAIATWSFAEMLKQISLNMSLFGKGFGIPLKSPLSSEWVLYLMSVIASTSVIINIIIERSRVGRIFMAIRDNESVALQYGINTTLYKILAYMISSVPASLAGALYSFWVSYTYAGDVFSGLKTDTMFMMLLLGGVGSYIGALIGALVFGSLHEILWSYIGEQLYLIMLGIFMMLVVLFMPQGIGGFLRFHTVSARRILLTLTPREFYREFYKK